MLLMQAKEDGAALDDEETLFLAGVQGNTFDADVDDQTVRALALNDPNIFQAEDFDAFDSDVDDEPTAQTIFMANLSSAISSPQQNGLSNSSVISEVLKLYDDYERANELKTPENIQQTNVVETNNANLGSSNIHPVEHHMSHSTESDVHSVTSSKFP